MNTVVSKIIADGVMFVLYLYSFKIMDAPKGSLSA